MVPWETKESVVSARLSVPKDLTCVPATSTAGKVPRIRFVSGSTVRSSRRGRRDGEVYTRGVRVWNFARDARPPTCERREICHDNLRSSYTGTRWFISIVRTIVTISLIMYLFFASSIQVREQITIYRN